MTLQILSIYSLHRTWAYCRHNICFASVTHRLIYEHVFTGLTFRLHVFLRGLEAVQDGINLRVIQLSIRVTKRLLSQCVQLVLVRAQ
ncbi:hypothetical protein Y032_0179g751 [Ancylostoma ceylanicum]|uniref:Uncharacterized protein n=1 Tax=Ancylostoma ceylanicum TaxID=53326 RepID=A0A016ST91_9BILA|nr:hypothetical protein Y032_0179g751 [Ancylostoma ceylanicum]